MEMRMSDYITTPRYRKNSKHLVDDLEAAMLRKGRTPPWWYKYKPHPRGVFGWIASVVTYPSYWVISSYGKRERAGRLAKKLNFGSPQNEYMSNITVRSASMNRMSHKIYNARVFLGNEAMYLHDGR